ncbi:MAG TPA: HAD-IA family hydrolase [Acidimicrobiales bacterium]|nr:HAD-IA family hydrolase [Acidimicrobiales bacterium]
MIRTVIRAVLFDFGGVILTSPFEAFARYEAEVGLPGGFIRHVNTVDPDTNAWAQLERGSVTLEEFVRRFEGEARALGHEVDGERVLGCLAGDVRPEMVEALRRCHERLKTACLTNNHIAFSDLPGGGHPEILEHFDAVIESSQVGVRKPDPRFYEIACETLDVKPDECVFLDDLGINLKPARTLGMTTIKVTNPAKAITALEALVAFPLR